MASKTSGLDFMSSLVEFMPKEEQILLEKDLSQISSEDLAAIEKNNKCDITPYELAPPTAKKVITAALAAFQKLIITPQQLASIHILDGAIRDLLTHSVSHTVYCYIDKEELKRKCIATPVEIDYQIANQMISKHKFDKVFSLDDKYKSNFEVIDTVPMLKSFFDLDEQEWLRFSERLNGLSGSEQYFHTITLPTAGCWSPMYERVKSILRPLQPQKYLEPHAQGIAEINCMVIPSFSMLQAFVDTRAETFNRESFNFQPVYAKDIKDIELRSLYEKGRVPLHLYWPESSPEKQYSLENPAFSKVNKTFFGNKEGPFETILFDIFRALRELETPKNIRDACIYLADLAEKHPKNIKQEGFTSLSHVLSCSELMINSQTRLFKTDGSTGKQIEAFSKTKFGDVFYIRPIVNRLDQEIKNDLFIKDMVTNQLYWRKQFDLGREDLRPEDQTVFDSLVTKKS